MYVRWWNGPKIQSLIYSPTNQSYPKTEKSEGRIATFLKRKTWTIIEFPKSSSWHHFKLQTHLNSVRLFRVFVLCDTEAQGIFGALNQHQSGALKNKHNHEASLSVFNNLCLFVTYRYVRLVNVVFSTAFGKEQHAVEQEECSLVFGPMNLEGPLQNQFSIGSQIRTFPVQQQGLDLLRPEDKMLAFLLYVFKSTS